MSRTKVTIVLPISRADYLAQVFAYLELMDCDAGNTNLIAIVDGSNELYVDARNRVEMSKFAERLCVKYDDPGVYNKNDILDRRERISDIHNTVKTYIGECDYIFGVEDDTLVPKHALQQLLKGYVLYPYAGFIEGVELGRWSTYYVGAWKVDDVYNPTNIKSQLPPDSQYTIQEIDSGGFYCFLTKRDNYINHTFKTFNNNTLGPDVDFGISLRRQGFSNYIDWGVSCIHRNRTQNISLAKDTPETVEFFKNGEFWEHKIY